MAIDASGVLGSRQLAGVKVNPPGYAARQIRTRSGPGVGILVTEQPAPGRSDTPPFGRLAYLAVTGEELALVSLTTQKSGAMQAAEVIARVPRSALEKAELGPAYIPPLTFTFTDGSTWRMDVPPVSKRSARAVVGALGGRLLTRRELPSQPAPPMSGYRIACGILWAVLAVIFVAGGAGELTISNVPGAVLCFALAVPSAWYDYRIWTRKARRLLLIF